MVGRLDFLLALACIAVAEEVYCTCTVLAGIDDYKVLNESKTMGNMGKETRVEGFNESGVLPNAAGVAAPAAFWLSSSLQPSDSDFSLPPPPRLLPDAIGGDLLAADPRSKIASRATSHKSLVPPLPTPCTVVHVSTLQRSICSSQPAPATHL